MNHDIFFDVQPNYNWTTIDKSDEKEKEKEKKKNERRLAKICRKKL